MIMALVNTGWKLRVMLTPPHVKSNLETEWAVTATHRKPCMFAHLEMRKTHGDGPGRKHSVMTENTLRCNFTSFHCPIAVGMLELCKKWYTFFFFSGLNVEWVQTISSQHFSDSFITTKFLLAVAHLELALVLVEEKLVLDEVLCLFEPQLGKNTSNKHLIFDQV